MVDDLRSGDGLKNLVKAAVNSEPRSILDWFHISMPLRPIEQMVAKVAGVLEKDEPDMATFVTQRLPNIRHQMCNRWWWTALDRTGRLKFLFAQAKITFSALRAH